MLATLIGFGMLVGIGSVILVMLYGCVATLMTLAGTLEWEDNNLFEKLTIVVFCIWFVVIVVWGCHEVGVKYLTGRLF